MAYEFKKLSAVEAVETPANTANVLIEENGVIKRVPKGEVGGVKVASTAEVGQILVVKAVDKNGKPTEWKCVDLSSSGSGSGVVHVRFFVARVDGNLVYTCDHTESEIYELIKNGDNLLYATVESPDGGEIQVTSGYFYYATHTYSDDDNATFVNPYSKSMLQVSSDGNVYPGKLTA